jgi:hypothetical protein
VEISKQDLIKAASQGLISAEQADALWKALEARGETSTKLDFVNFLYFFGAMIVIAAMGWLMTSAWENGSGWGICAIAALYALGFVVVGRSLWFREKLKVVGGLLFTMAVCMTPLAVYGFERATGLWVGGDPGVYRNFHEWIRGGWILMEVGTITAGLIALKFVRFPFLTAPVAFCLWYMSMDVTPVLLGQSDFTWHQRLWVSAWFGLAILLVSYLVDRRTKEDFAFWGYLFGTLAFWGGLSLMESGSQMAKFIYCLINLALMISSVLLGRRVFMVFGALGVGGYLGYLSYDVFKDSALFPFVLTAIGLVIIFAGVKFQRNQTRIESAVFSILPQRFRQLLPRERVA